MGKIPTRRELEAIAYLADRDLRSVKRYFAGLPMRPRTRDSVETAIASIEAAHLLAEPMADPDAAEDLGR